MRTKTLICAFLCVLLMGMTAFAAQSTEETLSENTSEQAETTAPADNQVPPQGEMPQGEMPRGGFGGRGGERTEMPGGMPRGGESPQMPADNGGTQQGGDSAAESTENLPAENGQGQMPQGGFGGFGGRGGMGGNMKMPGQQQIEETSSQTETAVDVDYSTVISAAILLVLGFFFVIFYKRKTF